MTPRLALAYPLTPSDAMAVPPRASNGQVWVGPEVMPWVAGRTPGVVVCSRCSTGRVTRSAASTGRFVWEHGRCKAGLHPPCTVWGTQRPSGVENEHRKSTGCERVMGFDKL